jgi:two-component system OmpR family response regulator|tara:strand:- start:383 stop:1072 length:690 start_codon:yes stop_codon:yes gene_type:complete
MAETDVDILIADDEANILMLLEMELQAEGYSTTCCEDGGKALAAIREAQPSIALLDWNMPIISGLDVCRRLRDTGNQLPVIMITARDEMDDRIAALEAGADDFIAKPFNIREVLARVKALLRRSTVVRPDHLNFGDLALNGPERRCHYAGSELNLTVREFDLLECFMRNPRQALSRSQLIQHVWGDDYFGDDNVVDVYVRYLRKKLEDVKSERVIQTIRGVGFALRLEA